MEKSLTALLPAARTYLFVPGDRPERFGKAWDSLADEVILDLEDAVSPERKSLAREAIANWLQADRPVWVRCNAVDTQWFEEDVKLARHEGLAGFVVPKAEEIPASLSQAVRDKGIGLIPLIETAVGFHRAQALASVEGVRRLAFGSIDFQVDLGIDGEDDALLYFRSQLVLASRLAGRPSPIDGVTADITDSARIRAEAERSRRLGMGAKLCIHPGQIAMVHEVFEPSAAQRDWAERVLLAMERSGGAAATVDGKMVDRPVLLRALNIGRAPAANARLRT
jgi:citrate lyase subunit beta/citryl-CoA lyase